MRRPPAAAAPPSARGVERPRGSSSVRRRLAWRALGEWSGRRRAGSWCHSTATPPCPRGCHAGDGDAVEVHLAARVGGGGAHRLSCGDVARGRGVSVASRACTSRQCAMELLMPAASDHDDTDASAPPCNSARLAPGGLGRRPGGVTRRQHGGPGAAMEEARTLTHRRDRDGRRTLNLGDPSAAHPRSGPRWRVLDCAAPAADAPTWTTAPASWRRRLRSAACRWSAGGVHRPCGPDGGARPSTRRSTPCRAR